MTIEHGPGFCRFENGAWSRAAREKYSKAGKRQLSSGGAGSQRRHACECVNRRSHVPSDLERFLELVCRELGADEARVVTADAERPEQDPRRLRSALVDGRAIEATFTQLPADRQAKQRRLDMLAGTFDPF